MRFAARPVGAVSTVSIFSESYTASIARSEVVLPVPGPPVMASTRLFAARSTASRCSGAYFIPRVSSSASSVPLTSTCFSVCCAMS